MARLTTRDYKRTSRGASGARLKDFGFGVLVGAVLASAAFVISGAHARHGAAAGSHSRLSGNSTGRVPPAPAPDEASSNSGGGADGNDAATTAPGASARSPQYDFYRMLPRLKVPVPHDDEHPSRVPPQAVAGRTVRSAPSGPSYILQVGSYRSSAEADQVRARLARFGLSAQVQRILEGATTWNRVRIGPLTDAELARVRDKLRAANVRALVIRADR